jgi:hypothetical protein
MGNFYVNYTLRGVTQAAAAKAMNGRAGVVTPSRNECVVVFDSESDKQNPKIISSLAAKLSKELKCAAWVVLNHDDDILWYQLYVHGKLADEYDSTPGYFDSAAEPSPPRGGSAKLLCSTFGSTADSEVEQILRSSLDDGDYVFAVERHADLVRALGLPQFAVGTAYHSFERDEYPEGLAATDVMRTK